MAMPKTLLVELYCEDRVELSIVSECWVLNEDELLYPKLVKGPKREKFLRTHQVPDPSTWTKYPYTLLKVCGEFSLNYPLPYQAM